MENLFTISKRCAKNPARIFFLLSCVMFIGGIVGTNVAFEQIREIPHEPDDHYHYLAKSTHIANCVIDDCPGLQSLFAQASQKTDSRKLNIKKDRQLHRVLFSYHPVYSLSILSIKTISGLSYEKSQYIFEITVGIATALSAILFLVAFFGYGPATVTLLLLAFHLISGHGIHSYPPHVSALFPIWLCFVLALQKAPYRYAYCIPLMLLSSGLHLIGIIMSAMFATFAFFYEDKRWSLKMMAFYAVSLSVTFFYFFHFNFVDADLNVFSFYQEKGGLWSIIKLNATNYFYIIFYDQKILPFFMTFFFLPLGLYFIFIKQKPLEKKHIIMAAIALFALITALFYPNPSAGLTGRLWPLVGIYFMGFIGTVFYQLISYCYRQLQKENTIAATMMRKDNRKNIAIVFLLSAFVIFSMAHSYNNLHQFIQSEGWQRNIYLDETQVDRLVRDIKDEEIVLYDMPAVNDEFSEDFLEPIVYFYLIHGSHQNKMLWSDIYPNYQQALSSNVAYLVTKSPVIFGNDEQKIHKEGHVTSFGGDWIFLPHKFKFYQNGKDYALSGDWFFQKNNRFVIRNPNDTDFLSFYVLSKNSATRLRVENIGEELLIPANYEGWVDFALGRKISDSPVTVHVVDAKKPVRVLGLRFSEGQSTYWPWNQRVTLTVNDKIFTFQTDDLSPTDLCRVQAVMHDKGASLLAKIDCR